MSWREQTNLDHQRITSKALAPSRPALRPHEGAADLLVESRSLGTPSFVLLDSTPSTSLFSLLPPPVVILTGSERADLLQ